MKLNGIAGSGTGKMGNMVFATRNGEQIVRQYQPNVANPSTPAQVQQRAKMKLMSQLATVVAPVIAIKAQGLRTKRNEFTKENFPLTSFADDAAQINLNAVQLTKSVIANVGFKATRSAGQPVAVELDANASASADKAVYIMLEKKSDGSLELVGETVVSEAGASGKFAGTLPSNDGEIVILGYTVKANSAKASAKFENMIAPTAAQVAKVIADRTLSSSDITDSKTAGLTMPVGTNSADTEVIS